MTRSADSIRSGATNNDAVDRYIKRLSPEEIAFYTECAARVGETLREWIAHMDEI